MSKRIQLRRGTTTETNAFTGAVGEVTVDTTKNVVVVHDGVTAGGTPMLKASDVPSASETVQGKIEIATQTEVNTGTDAVRAVTPNTMLSGVKNHLNASGSAPLFACRAWVNFDGINNNIRAGGNVSSVTDNGTGDYTVNLTTPLQDQNYSIVATMNQSSGNTDLFVCSIISITNSSVRINCRQGNKDFTANVDSNILSVAIFR